jgi:hypothetical protein
MKITLNHVPRMLDLLTHLQASGCIAYIDDEPWTITVFATERLETARLQEIVREWQAANRGVLVRMDG